MEKRDIAISGHELSKSYLVSDQGTRRVRFFHGGSGTAETYTALRGVSVTVREKETIGIVGRNGAGKSTLLKLLAGISQPDLGYVESNGHVIPVIGPAAGMKPELSGRDNIEIRAATLGMSMKELDGKIGDIIKFADIGDYIDRPFRMYSAGMKARLGFAVSFAFQPDILLIDETLAGGDDAFRRKVLARVSEIQQLGATIVLVSHAPNMIVQFCDRAILLERGEKLMEGRPKAVIDAYQKLLLAGDDDYDHTIAEIRAVAVGGEHEGRTAPEPGSNEEERVKPQGGADTRSMIGESMPEQYSGTPELLGMQVPATRWEAVPVGAFVTSVVIETADDPEYYYCKVEAKVNQPVRDLTGMVLLKTAEGIEAAVVYLEPVSKRSGEELYRGPQTLAGYFVNRLQAGFYTLDASINGMISNERIRLHTIRDAMEFQCITPSGDQPGIVDLTVKAPAQESAVGRLEAKVGRD